MLAVGFDAGICERRAAADADTRLESIKRVLDLLSRLAARHGAYFVTGNHEYYSGARAWSDELRRLGLRVLINEHVVLQHGAAEL